MNKVIIYLIWGLIFLSNCSTPRPEGRTEAEVLFKEAHTLIDDERYLLANEKLNQIRSQHPYSYYSTHAELLQADILFKQESYVEAASAYIVFRDFHPKYKDISYVIWMIAESFYNQMPSTFDRDLTPGQEAIKYYQELVRLFPDSKYKDDAKDKVKYCEEMIESKQLYIADFYYRTEEFKAARYRYLDILSNFNQPNIQKKAMQRVLESSLKLKDKKECSQYYYKFINKADSELRDDLMNLHNKCLKLEDIVQEEG